MKMKATHVAVIIYSILGIIQIILGILKGRLILLALSFASFAVAILFFITAVKNSKK